MKEKASLARLGLEALISLEGGKRLARPDATEENMKDVKRHRSV